MSTTKTRKPPQAEEEATTLYKNAEDKIMFSMGTLNASFDEDVYIVVWNCSGNVKEAAEKAARFIEAASGSSIRTAHDKKLAQIS